MKEIRLNLIRRTKPEREECLFSKWIFSQGNPAVKINHFEGSGPEWLVHKRTLCFRQRARLWEREKELTYWCMPANLTFYLFLSFSSNIPLSYLFSFFLFFLILVFYFLVFKFLIPWCLSHCPLYTTRASFYSAYRDWVLLF